MADLTSQSSRCRGLRPHDVFEARRQLRALTDALTRLPHTGGRRSTRPAVSRVDRELAHALHLSLTTSRIRLARLRSRVRRAIESLDARERGNTPGGAHHGA